MLGAGTSEHYTVIDAAPQIPTGPTYFADFFDFTDEGSVDGWSSACQRVIPGVGKLLRGLTSTRHGVDIRPKRQYGLLCSSCVCTTSLMCTSR